MQILEQTWNKALHCSFDQFPSTRQDHWMPIASMYPDIVYVQYDVLMAGIIDLWDESLAVEQDRCWIAHDLVMAEIHWMLLVLLPMIHDCYYEVTSHHLQTGSFVSWKMNVMLLMIRLIEEMKNVVVDLTRHQNWDEDDG